MKKYLVLSISLIVLAFGLMSLQRTKSTISVNQGEFKRFGGTAGDTVVVSDTVNYVFNVTHLNDVNPYGYFLWDKVGSGNPTVTMLFYQSIDGVNYVAVQKGAALGAYTKTLSPTADTYYECSFAKDTAFFEGKYLKITFRTTNTANVKGKVDGFFKFNID